MGVQDEPGEPIMEFYIDEPLTRGITKLRGVAPKIRVRAVCHIEIAL